MAKMLSGQELDQFVESVFAAKQNFNALYEERKVQAESDLTSFLRRCRKEIITIPRFLSWLCSFVAALLGIALLITRVGVFALIFLLRAYTSFGQKRQDDDRLSTNTTPKTHPELYAFVDSCCQEAGTKPIKQINLTMGQELVIVYEHKSIFSPPVPVLQIGIITLESLTENQFRDAMIWNLMFWKGGAIEFRYKAATTYNSWFWPSLQRLIKKDLYDKKVLWNLNAWLNSLSAECHFRADKMAFESGRTGFLVHEFLYLDRSLLDQCFYSTVNKVERAEADRQYALYTFVEEFRKLLASPEFSSSRRGLAQSKSTFEDISPSIGERLARLNINANQAEEYICEAARLKEDSAGSLLISPETFQQLSNYIFASFNFDRTQRANISRTFHSLQEVASLHGDFETYAYYDIEMAERDHGVRHAKDIAEFYVKKFPFSWMIHFEYASRLAALNDPLAIEAALKALRLNSRLHFQVQAMVSRVSRQNGLAISDEIQKEIIRAERLTQDIETSLQSKYFKNFEPYIPAPYELESFKRLCDDLEIPEAYTAKQPLADGSEQKVLVFASKIGKYTPKEMEALAGNSDYALLEYIYICRSTGNPLIIEMRKHPNCKVV